MPLPASNTPWPPKQWAPQFADMALWDVWWTGDRDRLHSFYQRQAADSYRPGYGGLMGKLQRFFWGRARGQSKPSRGDLHIPVASDLCATSADLLYSEPPSITTGHAATDEVLERYIDDGLFDALMAGAERGAALGGRYHRVVWDPTVSERPFLDTVDSDHALPEFRWGRLTAVTFWTVVHKDNNTVWRHLERHELDTNRMGRVYHGLYEGTTDNLGRLVPLTEHESTAALATLIGPDTALTEGVTEGLMVAYIPNVTPNRRWRTEPHAMHLGRSDLDGGVIPLMDALDETMSSLMRDIRLGRARVFADENILQTAANGEQVFDLDQEIFTPLAGMGGSLANTLPIHPQQFAIRVAEHQQTAADLMRRILNAARYSSATFGDDVADTDVTATEVKARQSRTLTTRNRKIRLEKPAVQALTVKLLRTDEAVFNTRGLNWDDLAVTFPAMGGDPLAEPQSVAMLKGAGLLAVRTGVELLHPDWDTTQVDAEVAALAAESPLTSPDSWRPTEREVTEDEEGTGIE